MQLYRRSERVRTLCAQVSDGDVYWNQTNSKLRTSLPVLKEGRKAQEICQSAKILKIFWYYVKEQLKSKWKLIQSWAIRPLSQYNSDILEMDDIVIDDNDFDKNEFQPCYL